MKYYALYNPLAGNGAAEGAADSLMDKLSAEIIKCDVTKIQSYEEFFANICEDDAVIICGGDGTINRFINDTASINIPCDILYFAAGSGNDFLTDLGKTVEDCPFSIKKYLSNLPTTIVKGKEYKFINNVGFGIDGYCCEVGDKLKAESTKAVNYTAVAIKGLLFHYKPTNAVITVDGKEYTFKKVWLAPTMKGRYYGGGMMAAPEQNRMDPDGELSVMLFYGGGRLATLMAFPSIFKGEHVKKTKMVKILTGKSISVKFDGPRAVQIDGETILDVTEYSAYAKAPAKVTE